MTLARGAFVASRVVVRVYLLLASLVTTYGASWMMGMRYDGRPSLAPPNDTFVSGAVATLVLLLVSTLIDRRPLAGWPFAALGLVPVAIWTLNMLISLLLSAS